MTLKRIGVTGGIGSGKTTVCRMLEAFGARVFYADREGKWVLEHDDSARQEVLDAFGPDTYRPDGSLRRAFLAKIAFGDDAKLEQLNAIVHPRVLARFEEEASKAEREGAPFIVKEAALVFETGGERLLDEVIVVDAPRKMRMDRATARDGASREAVTARMRRQLDSTALRERAHYVIDNDGDVESLRRQVEVLYRKMLER